MKGREEMPGLLLKMSILIQQYKYKNVIIEEKTKGESGYAEEI